jgi:cytoskeletal protein CcmA (bactofilin family)
MVIKNMQIAKLTSKIVPISSGTNKNNLITKKIEAMSSNFKSTPTILARDLKIEGDISSAGLIEIEGIVKGTIVGNAVILREEGSIVGDITAESLSLRGTFEGKIKAKTINISGKAKVIGDIEYESLSVEDGASIEGQFKRVKSTS